MSIILELLELKRKYECGLITKAEFLKLQKEAIDKDDDWDGYQ